MTLDKAAHERVGHVHPVSQHNSHARVLQKPRVGADGGVGPSHTKMNKKPKESVRVKKTNSRNGARVHTGDDTSPMWVDSPEKKQSENQMSGNDSTQGGVDALQEESNKGVCSKEGVQEGLIGVNSNLPTSQPMEEDEVVRVLNQRPPKDIQNPELRTEADAMEVREGADVPVAMEEGTLVKSTHV